MGNQFFVLIFATHVMHPLRFPKGGIRAKRPGPLQGVAARRGSSSQGAATRGHGRLRLARKGLPPAANPAASRGGDAGRKGGRRLRRGSGGGGAMKVKED
ncbi:hypothetical protein BHM03_00053002 [Ensete ventricosum]|nr:hypothetical protein BHM03_00053002 [Ensete ventricosum]